MTGWSACLSSGVHSHLGLYSSITSSFHTEKGRRETGFGLLVGLVVIPKSICFILRESPLLRWLNNSKGVRVENDGYKK